MNKVIKNFGITSVCLFLLQAVSCRKAPFEEARLGMPFLSFEQPKGVYLVPTGNAFSKDLDKISVPVEISLSEAAPENFSVGLTGNINAAKQVISSHSLDNTDALELSSYSIPVDAEVRFGVKKVSFNIFIPISVIEINFGKKIAIGVDLANATKGHGINPLKKTVVVVVNTNDVLTTADVHYISFNKAGLVNALPINTTKDALTLNIPLQIDLSGSVGKAFSMKLVSDPAAVNALIVNGSLANTQLLSDAAVSYPQFATMGLNLNTAQVQLSFNIADLLVKYGTKWAFALTLAEPDKYQVSDAKKTVVVIIDPSRVLDEITLLLKNTAQPFISQTLDPIGKRWGKLASWTTNDAVNTFKGTVGYGSFDTNNGTNIAIESFSPDRPNITNGKIFQSVALPVGNYKFQVSLRSGSNSGTVYAAAAQGTLMPDVTLVPANTLGFVKLTSTTGAYTVNFRVNANNSTVSLGMSATVTQNTSFNINNVKLFRVLD